LQSLLSTRQSKWAKEMLRNVRLACCVAGVCNLVVKVCWVFVAPTLKRTFFFYDTS
jgi:hypothetical protein